MAEGFSLGKSINLGSDQVPENLCDPCHDIHGDVKPVAGYCLNCDEGLCKECYNFHLRRKQFRNHKLQVDKPKTSKSKVTSLIKLLGLFINYIMITIFNIAHLYLQWIIKI